MPNTDSPTPEELATLSPERLAEIAARAEAAIIACPGDWHRGEEQDGEQLPDGSGYAGDWYPTNEILASSEEGDRRVADANCQSVAMFIAHARQDIPDLLAEVARLAAELDAAKAGRDEAEAVAWALEGFMNSNPRRMPFLTYSCRLSWPPYTEFHCNRWMLYCQDRMLVLAEGPDIVMNTEALAAIQSSPAFQVWQQSTGAALAARAKGNADA